MKLLQRIRLWLNEHSPTSKPREWLVVNALVLVMSIAMLLIACLAPDDPDWVAEFKQDYLVYNLFVSLLWFLEVAPEAFPVTEDGVEEGAAAAATPESFSNGGVEEGAAAADRGADVRIGIRGITEKIPVHLLHFLVAATFLSDAVVALCTFRWENESVAVIVCDLILNLVAYAVIFKYTFDRVLSGQPLEHRRGGHEAMQTKLKADTNYTSMP